MNLEQLVHNLELVHGGGEPFFNALDASLCCADINARVYNMIPDPARKIFLLTGHFGRQFRAWMRDNSKPHVGWVLFPGGMRDGRCRTPEYNVSEWDFGSRYVFVDDSYFSGNTRWAVLNWVGGHSLVPAYVAYDGSLVQEQFVTSLYRYHREGDAWR